MSSTERVVLRFRSLVTSLTAAVVVVALVGVADGPAQAVSFSPAGSVCLDDASTPDPDPFNPGSPGECDGDDTPGASEAITTVFNILAPDANVGTLIHFAPPEWGVALDEHIPDGTLVGKFRSQATVGLINNACSTSVLVSFDMLDATTNMSQQVIFNDQWDLAGGLPRGVTEYPDYLTRVLVEDTGDLSTTLQPIARYYGQTFVAGVALSLNFALFEPGVTLRGIPLAPQFGYPSVTVLQSGGDPDADPEPSAITDFCSPTRTSISFFDNVRTNPGADGAFTFVTFAGGPGDADNDGHENALDTCPFIPNPDWDPRDWERPYQGDRDSDRIPDNCDPLPDDIGAPGGRIFDHDGDGYSNSQDNCPLVRNSKGINSPFADGPDNQADTDHDAIGDACDPNPNSPDGSQSIACLADVIAVGTGGTPALDPAAVESMHSFMPCGSIAGSQADIKVEAVSLHCSPDAEPNVPFTCAADVIVHNNGPTTGVGVGGAVNVGLPNDCTVEDYTLMGKGFGTLTLDVSVSQIVSKDFTITCTDSGLHQIVGCAVVEIREAGVVDPNPYNDFDNAQAFTEIDGTDLRTVGRCSVLDPPEVCGNGIDDDADTLVDEEPDTDGDGVSDCDDKDDDGDGFTDEHEESMGTDPLAACPTIGVHPAWPPDFDNNQVVDIVDVLALRPVFGTAAPPTSPRYDLAPSGQIDIVDVLALKPVFGESCT